MSIIDYSREPHRDIAFVDMKSFYAGVECVRRGLHPLKTSLCVMSRQDDGYGLILAASPLFKSIFGKGNVGRAGDLPFLVSTRKFNPSYYHKQGVVVTEKYRKFIEDRARQTVIVPPRMALYIEENMKIQQVFRTFAPEQDILPYSIDEGFIDLTQSIPYFFKSSSLSRKEALDILSAKIQRDIYRKTGLYSTVGMSNANPLLAKLALDNEAKKTSTMRANWSYEDVETKVWNISPLSSFWGIGHRMEKRLWRLGIFSIRDLAHANPDLLQKKLGVIGVQLWFHAHGVDESRPSLPYIPKERSIGNSQVLPRDYSSVEEIRVVLSEMAEQVAVRLRKMEKMTTEISIHIGFSKKEGKPRIMASKKIPPTDITPVLKDHVLTLFHGKYQGGAIRRIAVSYSKFTEKSPLVYSFFEDPEKLKRERNLDRVIDGIREKYGVMAVQRASALTSGSRIKERSTLIGGHCGGLEGIL